MRKVLRCCSRKEVRGWRQKVKCERLRLREISAEVLQLKSKVQAKVEAEVQDKDRG